jgi:tripartite-type tricarboxylate transporter receptor subunit TctC
MRREIHHETRRCEGREANRRVLAWLCGRGIAACGTAFFAIARIGSFRYHGKNAAREDIMRHQSGLTRRSLLAGSAALAVGGARAQGAWPNRPVRVIVPYPPAGGADTVSRILFGKLGDLWSQQFVIDNRGGAGGTIAEAAAAKADPDGYTILYDATAFSVNSALYPKLSFDYIKDFQPVFLASLVPNFLLVHPSVPVRTVADLIALAKSTPGGLDFASSGNGTLQHLCLEMFRHATSTKINHIPYRGGGLALNDVIGGQVKFFFSNASSSIGQVQGGTVKAIAHTGKGRLRTLPDLPSVAETLPGFEAYEWNGVFVPAGTPSEIIRKLNAGLNETLRQPDIIARLQSLNVDFRENTPEEFRAFVAAEMDKWSRVVKDAGIKLG